MLYQMFLVKIFIQLSKKKQHIYYILSLKIIPLMTIINARVHLVLYGFLRQSHFPLADYITPNMLTALALFIAESEPQYKPRIIGLILELLTSNKRYYSIV